MILFQCQFQAWARHVAIKFFIICFLSQSSQKQVKRLNIKHQKGCKIQQHQTAAAAGTSLLLAKL